MGTEIPSLDLTNHQQTASLLRAERPEVVINTAAYTAVDAAESDASRCMAVNHLAVENLAAITSELNCTLVQISTDYVFAGVTNPRGPFGEDSAIAPIGVYAQSKAYAETATRVNPRHLIIRTCGIYGETRPGAGGNFVNTMLRLGASRPEVQVVADQICCPTWVEPLADAIAFLVDSRHTGTFHVVNDQGISWYEFACEIFALTGMACQAHPISTAQYKAAAPRPAYSELDISKYRQTGGPAMATCREALAAYLNALAKSN
jgi:dTDP-4-dehydrorhamnose reductase